MKINDGLKLALQGLAIVLTALAIGGIAGWAVWCLEETIGRP